MEGEWQRHSRWGKQKQAFWDGLLLVSGRDCEEKWQVGTQQAPYRTSKRRGGTRAYKTLKQEFIQWTPNLRTPPILKGESCYFCFLSSSLGLLPFQEVQSLSEQAQKSHRQPHEPCYCSIRGQWLGCSMLTTGLCEGETAVGGIRVLAPVGRLLGLLREDNGNLRELEAVSRAITCVCY